MRYFSLSSLSNVLYNLFHSYNDLKWKTFQLQSCRSGGELQLSYKFFFPSEVIWNFWKFEIQNLNYIFGWQNNLNWKNLNYKVLDLVEVYNFCIDQFFIWDNLNFSNITCSNINKSHKGDTPWYFMSPMSSQRWRTLILRVTFYLSKFVIYTNLICDVL